MNINEVIMYGACIQPVICRVTGWIQFIWTFLVLTILLLYASNFNFYYRVSHRTLSIKFYYFYLNRTYIIHIVASYTHKTIRVNFSHQNKWNKIKTKWTKIGKRSSCRQTYRLKYSHRATYLSDSLTDNDGTTVKGVEKISFCWKSFKMGAMMS